MVVGAIELLSSVSNIERMDLLQITPFQIFGRRDNVDDAVGTAVTINHGGGRDSDFGRYLPTTASIGRSLPGPPPAQHAKSARLSSRQRRRRYRVPLR